MKILLDHNIDWLLKRLLPDHEVRSTKDMGWEQLTNGQLLSRAEGLFDVMLTVDRNLQHQQNLAGRQIAIIVLIAANNTRAALIPLMTEVETLLLLKVEPGQLYEVTATVEPSHAPQDHEQNKEV